MKHLAFNGEIYEAQQIVKQVDAIIGYNGKVEAFSFKGISDFKLFQLADGETYDSDVIESLKVNAQNLDERTVGMQAIDDFTLQQTFTMDDRTVGMQAIDDYTLQLVNDQAAIIAQLQADVAALKGGV